MKTAACTVTVLILALALSLFPSVFEPAVPETAQGGPVQPSVTARSPGTAAPTDHSGETPGQAFMLAHAQAAQPSNGCIDAMVGLGCRMQSQIPVWNRFAGMFAHRFGITCPVGPTSRLL